MTFLGMDRTAWFGVLLAAAAISWCILLGRRIYNRRLRMLTMLLSALGLCQAVRLADRAQLFTVPMSFPLEKAMDILMGLVALAAIAVLQQHNAEQRSASMRLRLAEAERAEIAPDQELLLPRNTRMAQAVKTATP
jgi:hypothetical protein